MENTKEFEKDYDTLAKIISKHTKQNFQKVYEDMDRDLWMNPEEALKYNIIDEIIED